LVIGSGSASHNLMALDRRAGDTATPPPWVAAFDDWVADKIAAADTAALLAWDTAAPYAQRNHPSDEHFLPLFVALGAATPDMPGVRIHHSHTYGALSMDAYRFP